RPHRRDVRVQRRRRATLDLGTADRAGERPATSPRRSQRPGPRAVPCARPLRSPMGGDELPRSRRALTACVLGAALIWSRAASPATSFIPIPEIITDPNEGNTGGLLGVVLFLDEKDEIRYMLAPDVRYNRTKGVFPTFR